MAITRQRIRVYMNLDVDVSIDPESSKKSALNNELRAAAEAKLREMLNEQNPEFHSVRLVRNK